MTGGAVPYLGPYKQQQALAQQAYESALSSLAAKRSQTLQQYGYMPTADGGMAVDPSNPFGQYQQTLLQNQSEADQLEHAAHSRGFMGAGLGHQGENAGKIAEQGRMFNLGQALTGSLADLANQQQGAQFDLSNANLLAQMNSIQYAQDHHLFTTGKPMLGQQQVDQRVQRMAAAFAKLFGAAGTNRKGQTFQQRLNQISADRLYDPSAHYKIAGVKY
jgi:hypothetical protein